MEPKELRHLSISALILVIINDSYNDDLRRCAEVELRSRLKHFGWDYDDLLHFDDRAIKERGLEIDNYLVSPNVDMQLLMETYFKYCYNLSGYQSHLLFSEKHLCNDLDGNPFFRIVCAEEIKNIDKRLAYETDPKEREHLTVVKNALLQRNADARQARREVKHEGFIEWLGTNDATYQIDERNVRNYGNNLTPEQYYKIWRSPLRFKCASIRSALEETLFENDLMEAIFAKRFVDKDCAKLKKQRAILMHQVNYQYLVDYHSEPIEKALERKIITKRD